MNQYLIVATCVMSLLLSACTTPQGPNEQGSMFLGGAGGALGGALIGSALGNTRGALIGAGIGALAGSFAGKAIGSDMDQRAAPRYYQDDPRYYRDNPRYYRDDPRYYREDVRYGDRPRYVRPAYDDPYPYRY